MSLKTHIALIIFISLISYSNSLYRAFYLNREKCYIDNYYSEMNVIMQLKILDTDLNFKNVKDDRFIIKIYNNKLGDPIQTFQTGKQKAKFSYSINKSGRYMICVSTNDKNLFNKKKYKKLSFIIDTSEDIVGDANEVAKMKDFQIVDDKVKKLIKKAENIENMQKYQIKQEDEFAQNQMKSSQTLVFVTIIQLVICVIIGIYHFFSMKKIFKQKMWSPF